MATNPPAGDNHRQGAVRDRSQTYNPKNDHWVKRNTAKGQSDDQKGARKPLKGVRREHKGNLGGARLVAPPTATPTLRLRPEATLFSS